MTHFIELRHITKYFSHVVANQDVSFAIHPGEVLALLGENGAGKSTVMKILYGLYHADSGEILQDGKPVVIRSPRDAMNLGITMIQQHFSLVPAHTVTENLILGTVRGTIDWDAVHRKVAGLAAAHGFEIDPKAKVSSLAVGVQQKVEILKAIYQNTRLLIMDEPTAVLTPQESEQLMTFVKNFTAEGNSVVFITHKLQEVMEVADRIIVMRSGRISGDLRKDETNARELSRLMIGRELDGEPGAESREDAGLAPVRLSLENVTVGGEGAVPSLSDITLGIHAGEVFGIAGVSGNGQQELCEVLCGALPPAAGTIRLDGEAIEKLDIQARIRRGIGYVPSNRHRDGLVMNMTIAENMILKTSFDPRWLKNGLIDRRRVDEVSDRAISTYRIKASGPNAILRTLSGGNQQKVIVAREVEIGEKVIIFDQPTRGLDLGAIDNVHRIIRGEKEKGKAILLVSTELSEIMALSDRFTVLYKGKMQGVYRRGELSTEEIGLLMAGYRVGEGGAHG